MLSDKSYIDEIIDGFLTVEPTTFIGEDGNTILLERKE